ncbi:hypothetical protein OIU78_013397 [Salix suchowensis]|nr:hypothetical protein OIU78_013397 [Salix suchowensis]
MNWFINGGILETKAGMLGDGGKMWLKCLEKVSGNSCKIHHLYYQYTGSMRIRKTWWRKLLVAWIVGWIAVSVWIFWYMSSQAFEKRKETLASMCDERARMLQDQFNVSMNHVQAMSILISTFHHGKNPSAIDQRTFARYTERTAFERPLTSGVAYAVRVLHSEREQFENQQGWTIKRMDTFEQSPVQKDDSVAEALEPSPIQEEYAPVIFAQDTVAHVVSLDMLSGTEDRQNVLRARESGKGVLTAPFRLLKTNRLGVILTFAVYKTDLPSNAMPSERIQATDGYIGGIFDIESLVEKLLQQLASKQTILVNVYDITNQSHPISMYGSNVSDDGLEHVSALNFGDPFRKHEMRCRFKQKPPWPWLAITTSIGILVIVLLIGYIFHATMNRIAKVEDDCHKMEELKKRAEAADVAKSQFLATVSHEIRTPMNGVLGMLQMLMDTELDATQQDYVRTAQDSGKALVSLINEVLDQAKIESGKIELEAMQFDLRVIMDEVLALFSGKAHEKGVELAVYVSDGVPEMVIGDPGRFRQIITNLMGNSIKFTKKGHIFLTVHLVEEVMDSIDVETESSSRNTLSGLPVADGSRSWVDPSISRKYGGTGIGLSISKCLVGLMNGEIGFVSIPDIGSTFTFTAVFSNGCCNSNDSKPQKQRLKNQSNTMASTFQGMTALVVDPKPVRAKVSRYQIQRLGIHVELVLDLNQGLSSISNENKAVNMGTKLFLLGNSLSSSRTNTATSGFYTPSVITKPLKASMLSASLQRAMGGNKGNPCNGEHPSLSLRNLLAGRKILIVDDNKVNLIVAAAALKKYGADVVCADSGQKAIKLLKPPHKFDACFMDIQMPEMDGFEATRIIRDMESNGHIPILAMTADVIQATYEECQRCGMDGYVSKPFEAEQLYQEVSRFLQPTSSVNL